MQDREVYATTNGEPLNNLTAHLDCHWPCIGTAPDCSVAPVRWLSMSLRNRSYWNHGLTPGAYARQLAKLAK